MAQIDVAEMPSSVEEIEKKKKKKVFFQESYRQFCKLRLGSL
jgi:hypothetical protein